MHKPLNILLKKNRNFQIYIVFVAALLSMAMILIVSYRIERKLVESNIRKLHTTEILGTLDRVNFILLEAENSRREYMLLANTPNKQQYQIHTENIQAQLARLKKLTADDQIQQQRLSKLDALIAQKLANLGSSITDRDNSGYQPEQQSRMTEEGALLTLMIQTNIDEIINEKKGLLIELRAVEQTTLHSLIYFLWGGLIVAVAMLSSMFYFARREAASSKKTAITLLEKSEILESANSDITELSAMTEFLQSASSLPEAGEIISRYGSKFFKGDWGGIYVLNSSRNLVESLAVWGKGRSEAFTPDDCWSLRRGQPHVVRDHSDVKCNHVDNTTEAYICIPMAAQHETLGVLHVGFASHGSDAFNRNKQAMASAMAERVGLALRNLKLREQLREMSIRDALTGLLNRRYIEEALLREIARALRYDLPLGVVMMDIDNFKNFNDKFGHEAGDNVLKEFGHLLDRHVRGSDIACRFGGEEFTLILPEATKEAAFCRTDEIREAFKNLQLFSGNEPLGMVTISAGIAVFPNDGDSSKSLLAAADSALYRAKEMGRDRVELFLAS